MTKDCRDCSLERMICVFVRQVGRSFTITENSGTRQCLLRMRKKSSALICQLTSCLLLILILCEYLIYYVVISQCSWPEIRKVNANGSVSAQAEEEKLVKAMFLADIHLLGTKRGHWLDKLRREWQMYMAFQTTVYLFEPEVVFILGDLFDTGFDCSDKELQSYIKSLHSLFKVKNNTKIYFVVGNHDIGFHDEVTDEFLKKFVQALKTPPVHLISIRGNHFVLINSMAMEGDGCFLCKTAQSELIKIAKKLKCTKDFGKYTAATNPSMCSRPILLQHFPMYRESDKHCVEPDAAPNDEKGLDFYEGWDCLSKEASEMIYDFLEPRVILDGHTHHGCHVIHRRDIHEYTVASFNWRNKNNPNFLMGLFLPNNFAVAKCYIPRESTVIFLYCLGFLGILLFVILADCSKKHYRMRRKSESC